MIKESVLTGEMPSSALSDLLLPVITENGHLRSSVVLLQVEWHRQPGDWDELRKQILEMLRRSIRAGGDLLLPASACSPTRESFFILASTDLEHAQLMLRRIRERLAGLSELASCGSVSVSARGIWLPTRSGETSLEELTAQVAEKITRLARAADAQSEERLK